jgi:hypothetical protein
MILISLIHITDKERNVTLKFGNAFTINTQFTVAVVTLELRSAQQLIDKTLHDFSQDFNEVYLKWITTCFQQV